MPKRARVIRYAPASKRRATGQRNPVLLRRALRLPSQGIPNPPQWSPTIRVGATMRFIVNTQIGGGINQIPISNWDLLDLKCLAVTNTAAYRVYSAVKLTCVEVWSANAQGDSSNTVSVEFDTNNPIVGDSSRLVTDTAVGISNIAHVRARPAPASYSAMWLSEAPVKYTTFVLTAPEGSVVDVSYTFTLMDDEPGQSVRSPVAGATPGYFYTRHLDSDAVSPALLPVGVLVI